MKKEESIKDYSYLKKDLLKVLITTGLLVGIILVLSILENRTGFVSETGSKIMKLLIK